MRPRVGPSFGKRSRVSLGRYCWCARMHVRSSMNPAEQCVSLSLSLGLQRVWSNIHASLSTCLKHSLVQCLLRLASTTRHCVRAVKEMDSKSIGLCPQGFESPRCRFLLSLLNDTKSKQERKNERNAERTKRAKRQKCISRESNPGHIDGNDVFYH